MDAPSENTPGPSVPSASDAEVLGIPSVLPLLATRDIPAFPGAVVNIKVGRPRSLRLLEESLPQSKVVGLFAQRDAEEDDPGPAGLHRVGVACVVSKMRRAADATS